MLLVTTLTVIGAWSGAYGQVPDQPFEPGKGNLRMGPVRAHPFLTIGELYDDNVFLQQRNRKHDFITVLSPGTILDLPVGRHEFSLGYRADILEFASLNHEDTVRHTGRVQAKGTYPGGLSWYLRDEAKRTNERPNTEIDPLIERNQNDANAGMEYAFVDGWAVGVDYVNTLYDYQNQQPLPDGTRRDFGTELNRVEQLVTGDLYYLLQPKTALLLEYGYGEVSYLSRSTSAVRDNTIRQGRAGIRGRLTSKLAASVKLGYQTKDFDNSNQRGFDGFVVSGLLTYQPSDWTQIVFRLDRSTEEASFRSLGDQFYVAQRFTLRAEHVLSLKVRGYVSVTLANHDYLRSTRNDDLYAGAVGVRYQIQDYLGISGEYLYERRDAGGTPGSDFDYTDNRVFLRVTVRL